jgi:hypothetical protein
MGEIAGHLDERRPSRLHRLFEYLGGGLAVAQDISIGYVSEGPKLEVREDGAMLTKEHIITPAVASVAEAEHFFALEREMREIGQGF